MQEITVVAVGNIASDIRFLTLDSGAHRARFRLASTPRRFDRETGLWGDSQTSYVSVSCWRALADNLSSSLGKGDPVVVIGKLSVRDWERDGRKGTVVEIDATSVAPDLARGSAAFLGRARRVQSDGAAAGVRPTVVPTVERTDAASHDLTGQSSPRVAEERVAVGVAAGP